MLSRAKTLFLFICLFSYPCISFSGNIHTLSLMDFVRLASQFSSQAFSINDGTTLADMNVSSALHQFSPQLVPLANVGFNSSNSDQSLGLKLTQKTETGQSITAAVSANRLESDEYVVTNSHAIRAYLQVSQPLFRQWGKKYNRAALTRAELLNRKNEFLVARATQELVLDSIQKYYAAVQSEIQCRKTESSLTRARKYLEIAESRFSIGLVSKADVYRAELAQIAAENSYLEQERARDRALDEIRVQLNWSDNENFELNSDIQLLAPLVPEDFDLDLLSSHPEWQAQQIDEQLQQLSLYTAKRNLLPDISINLQAEQKGQGDSLSAAQELDETNWSISLQLNSTFDRFNEHSALTKERMAEAKLRRETKALKSRIKRNAQRALQELQAEERRCILQEKSLTQADKALDLAFTRYERGLSNNLELLDAEADYSSAEMGIVESRIAYNMAAAKLGRALGILDLEWLRISDATPVKNSKISIP